MQVGRNFLPAFFAVECFRSLRHFLSVGLHCQIGPGKLSSHVQLLVCSAKNVSFTAYSTAEWWLYFIAVTAVLFNRWVACSCGGNGLFFCGTYTNNHSVTEPLVFSPVGSRCTRLAVCHILSFVLPPCFFSKKKHYFLWPSLPARTIF